MDNSKELIKQKILEKLSEIGKMTEIYDENQFISITIEEIKSLFEIYDHSRKTRRLKK